MASFQPGFPASGSTDVNSTSTCGVGRPRPRPPAGRPAVPGGVRPARAHRVQRRPTRFPGPGPAVEQWQRSVRQPRAAAAHLGQPFRPRRPDRGPAPALPAASRPAVNRSWPAPLLHRLASRTSRIVCTAT
jgi:hypothetical protein